ncbi:MAG TPA: hypothetical protein VNK49_02955 [Anaerolineales bacterium]|nr:hypothetical protein [Anaerolineales bacterium]
MRYSIPLILVIFLIAACTPSPDTAVTSPAQDATASAPPMEQPFAPKPDDANFLRVPVTVQSASLLVRESYPPQIALALSGELPTPCHQLRVAVKEPDAENKIVIEVYSVISPETICIQVIKSFEETVELGTFSPGHYSVWVNGEMIGEFDA